MPRASAAGSPSARVRSPVRCCSSRRTRRSPNCACSMSSPPHAGSGSAAGSSPSVSALPASVAPDPSYRYELIETIPGDGYAAHLLEMTSQRWRDETEVDRPLWKHWLTDIEPEQVATGTALLISGPSR